MFRRFIIGGTVSSAGAVFAPLAQVQPGMKFTVVFIRAGTASSLAYIFFMGAERILVLPRFQQQILQKVLDYDYWHNDQVLTQTFEAGPEWDLERFARDMRRAIAKSSVP
jgi:hypothetical protein